MTNFTKAVLVLIAIGAVPQPVAADESDRQISVRGVITDEGVECTALRDRRGRLYTLAGNFVELEEGDRVHVRGTIAEVSYCQQGITIEVRRIRSVR